MNVDNTTLREDEMESLTKKQEDVLNVCLLHRDEFFEKDLNFLMQDGQKAVSDSIIENVLFKTGKEIFFEVSRQSGKTTIVVNTTIFLLLFIQHYWKKLKYHTRGLFEMGIFAPQFGQAKTAFDRLKYALQELRNTFKLTYDEANGNTLKINISPYRSIVYVFSLTPTSNIESKTMDFQIFDEAQKIPDEDMKIKALPMGVNTNACRVFMGTSGFRLCYYYEGLNRAVSGTTEKFIYDVYQIIEQKRKMYDLTGNPEFLNYEKKFKDEVREHGLGSDYIETQYLLKWKLEKGMFITPEMMSNICMDNLKTIKEDRINDVIIGIDCAKESDYTVVVAWRWENYKKPEWSKPKRCIRILDWYCVNKELYGDQWELVEKEFINNYKLYKLNVDSTGPGDGTADWFLKLYDHVSYDQFQNREKNGRRGTVRPVKFSSRSKHIMYSNLDKLIREGRVLVPRDLDSFGFNKFTMESRILIKEHKGDLLSIHHDDSPGATDDCWDALAVTCFDLDLEPVGKEGVTVKSFKREGTVEERKPGVITDKWLNQMIRKSKVRSW